MRETVKTTPRTCNRRPDGFDPQSSGRSASAGTAAFEPSVATDARDRRAGNKGGVGPVHARTDAGACATGGARTLDTSTAMSAMHSQPGDPGAQPNTRGARATNRQHQVGVPGTPETGTAEQAYVADYHVGMPGAVPGDPDVPFGSPGLRGGAVSAWAGPGGTRHRSAFSQASFQHRDV